MKKVIKYIFAFVIGSMIFTSCEDPYANQTVAKPGSYEQLALQDTTGFAAVIKTGISPLTIQANQLSDSLSLLTCTSVLTLADTAATTQYKIQFASTADFSNLKTIPISYNGKAGSDVKVSYKNFNDSIKAYNKNAVQRTVYIRLLAYIVNGGLKTVYTSSKLPLLVTPYNYPPVGMSDVVSLPMNSSVSIPVLTNDTDPESDALTVASTTTPAHGTTLINVDGTITYTPTTGYSGADSFIYTLSDGNGNTTTATVDINVLAMVPYTAVAPRPYYIIGLGDGKWTNTAAGLGVSIYPMSVVSGNKYNTTGDGEFSFTGYFYASKGFKLIRDIGSWDEQWGMSGSSYAHNNGGAGNITVPSDGYYTITLNSITNTLSIIPAIVTPTTYATIGLIGDAIGGWSTDVDMTAAESSNNHIWYGTFTLTTGSCKFRANNDWNPPTAQNWGTSLFPIGIGTNGGDNIPVTAGTYTVIFNDVDGTYYFK